MDSVRDAFRYVVANFAEMGDISTSWVFVHSAGSSLMLSMFLKNPHLVDLEEAKTHIKGIAIITFYRICFGLCPTSSTGVQNSLLGSRLASKEILDVFLPMLGLVVGSENELPYISLEPSLCSRRR